MFSVSRLGIMVGLIVSGSACHGIAKDTGDITALFAEDVQGTWRGAERGTAVTLSVTGREAKWTVKQKTPKGEESITAGPLECVVVSKAGWIDLLLPVKGEGAEPQHVGRLHRDSEGRILLKIYPADRYRPVEGLILRRLPSAKPKG
jgi:hypothetical protein